MTQLLNVKSFSQKKLKYLLDTSMFTLNKKPSLSKPRPFAFPLESMQTSSGSISLLPVKTRQ